MPWSKHERLKAAVRFILLLSLTLTTSIILAPTPVPSSSSLQGTEQEAPVAHRPQETPFNDANASLPISEHPVESPALAEAERSPVSPSAYEGPGLTSARASGDDLVVDAAKRAKLKTAFEQLPLYFIENQGQMADQVAYYTQHGGAGVYFTAQEVVMRLPETILRTHFVGADPDVRITGSARREAQFSYFIGDDPDGWHSGLRSYGKITYHDLYPGIDLAYTGHNGRLKYEFMLEPGADSDDIRMAYSGVEALHLAEDGDLLITPEGAAWDAFLRDAAPTIYQEIDGEREAVDGRFKLIGEDTYGFDVGEYAPGYSLVIDPQLSYSTFLGGSATDYGFAVATDSDDAVYLTGYSYSSDFPSTSGAYTETKSGSRDVFVSVLDSTLTTLSYCTFLGGASADEGYGIALDASGNVYVRGGTDSSDFPVTSGAYDTSYNGNKDVIVSAFDATLSNLLYSTFLGGSDYDWDGGSIALDSSGNVYVTGVTDSADFPTISGAYDTDHSGNSDIFVSVLEPTLSNLSHSTFLGGSGNDWTNFAIALDGANNVYLTGETSSSDFPTSVGAYDSSYSGGDAFVSALDPTLGTLRYSTFLGGSSDDGGSAVALDGEGNVYVVGETGSSDFPTTSGAYDVSYNGGGDIFASMLDPTLSKLSYSTFLGGTAGEWAGRAVALDSASNIYIVGETSSDDYPVTADAYDTSYNGGNDIFIGMLDPTLSSLSYSTFLGGSGWERPYATAISDADKLFATGYTESSDFPTTSAVYDPTSNGNRDAFVTVFDVSHTATHSISGQVEDIEGSPIPDVAISTQVGISTTTGTSGAYTVTGVISGTYTLTPTKSGWTFTPSTRTVTVPPSATNQDFTAISALPETFAGSVLRVYPFTDDTPLTVMQGGAMHRHFRVLDADDNPIANATITPNIGESALSDADGYFTTTVSSDALGSPGQYTITIQTIAYEGETYAADNLPSFTAEVTERRYANRWECGGVQKGSGGVSAGLIAYLTGEVGGGIGVTLEESNPDTTDDDHIIMTERYSGELGTGFGARFAPSIDGGLIGVEGPGADLVAKLLIRKEGEVKNEFTQPYEQAAREAQGLMLLAGIADATSGFPGQPLLVRMLGQASGEIIKDLPGTEVSAAWGLHENVDMGIDLLKLSFSIGEEDGEMSLIDIHLLAAEGDMTVLMGRRSGDNLVSEFYTLDLKWEGADLAVDIPLIEMLIGNHVGEYVEVVHEEVFYDESTGEVERIELSITGKGNDIKFTNVDQSQVTIHYTIQGDQIDRDVLDAAHNLSGLIRGVATSDSTDLKVGNESIASEISGLLGNVDIAEYEVRAEDGWRFSLIPEIGLELGLKINLGAGVEVKRGRQLVYEKGVLLDGRPYPTASYDADDLVMRPGKDWRQLSANAVSGLWDLARDGIHWMSRKVESGSTWSIGTIGATIEGAIRGGAQIDAPAGAELRSLNSKTPVIQQTDSVTVTAAGWVPLSYPDSSTLNLGSARAIASGSDFVVGGIYQFEPYTMTVDPAATLVITYTDAAAYQIDQDQIGLFRWTPDENNWQPMETVADTEHNALTTTITQLGTFALGYDDTPPEISILAPTHTSIIRSRVPLISALVTDSGTGIDPNTVETQLGDQLVTGEYITSTGQLTYLPKEPLADGTYHVTVRAADVVGNETSTSISFTVDTTRNVYLPLVLRRQ